MSNQDAMKKISEILQQEAERRKASLTTHVKQDLIAIRKDKNMTQREIGEATGMDTANITRIERDSYTPSLEVLLRYAEALGKTLEIKVVDKDQSE